MKIAVSSDENTILTRYVIKYLKDRGHEVTKMGALARRGIEWVDASAELGRSVASGKSDEGVLFCWTGTGSSITANKIRGIRAALCTDPRQARGARKWNRANVLVMSLQLTSQKKAKNILDVWFSEPLGRDDFDIRNVKKLKKLEMKER